MFGTDPRNVKVQRPEDRLSVSLHNSQPPPTDRPGAGDLPLDSASLPPLEREPAAAAVGKCTEVAHWEAVAVGLPGSAGPEAFLAAWSECRERHSE